MASRDLVMPVVLGAAAGAGVALVLGAVIKVVIDRQVTATIDREVPPRVRTELDNKLSEIGLTPQRSRQIAAFIDTLDQTGVFRTIGAGAAA